MLTAAEWQDFAPFMRDVTQKIQSFRETTGASLDEAIKLGFEAPALDQYFAITGFRESNWNAIWHHQLSDHGPPCRFCGKLLRTAKAKRCVECGKDAV